MNDIIGSVWNLAHKFMDDPAYVIIDDRKVQEVASDVKKALGSKEIQKFGYPLCIDEGDVYKLFVYELIANSVNYCFWYGRNDVRPRGSDSAKMYNLLSLSFHSYEGFKDRLDAKFIPYIINFFTNYLILERFPLLEQRIKHLNEVGSSDIVERFYDGERRFDILLISLIAIPGYGSDLFLKRAILLFTQLYRSVGLFEKEMKILPVPADYQVPKMLRYLGCIKYSNPLNVFVDQQRLIPEGSRMECEIRAATIIVCGKIAELAGCTCSDVDWYLFSKRKECKYLFHLCRTTSY